MRAAAGLLLLAGSLFSAGYILAVWPRSSGTAPASAPHPTPTPTPDAWSSALDAGWHLFLLALLVLIVAAGVIALWALILHARHRARMPAPDGRLPLEHPLLPNWYSVLEVQAGAVTPERVHYAPHYAPRIAIKGELPQPALPAPASAPTLDPAALLGAGAWAFGTNAAGEIVAEKRYTGVVLAGFTGSGKSTTLALMLYEAIAKGGACYVIDKQAGVEQSLAQRLGPLLETERVQVADDGPAALRLAEQVRAEMERRIRRQKANASLPEWPCVLAVDEWLSMSRLPQAERLAALTSQIMSEGRKVHVTAILASVSWLSSATGGSLIKNVAPTAVIHRTKTTEARLVAGRGDEMLRDAPSLADGEAIVIGDMGTNRVQVPELRLDTLLPTLPVLSPSSHGAVRNGSGRVPGEWPETGRESEIVALFRQGLGYPEIIAVVHGQVAGERFKLARQEVEAVLRRALKEE